MWAWYLRTIGLPDIQQDHCIMFMTAPSFSAPIYDAYSSSTESKWDVLTTMKNPQSNVICKRMQQTAGNIFRTLELTRPSHTLQEAQTMLVDLISDAFSSPT
jgi:hypothetical protein